MSSIKLTLIEKKPTYAVFCPTEILGSNTYRKTDITVTPEVKDLELFSKVLNYPHTVKCYSDGTVSVRFNMTCNIIPGANAGSGVMETFSFVPDKDDEDLFTASRMIAFKCNGTITRQIAFHCDVTSKVILGENISDR